MESNVYLIGVILGLGYIFYATLGWGQVPTKKFYNRLLDNRTFGLHVLLTAIVATIALYRCKNGYYRETFFLAPLLFLFTLRFFNYLTHLLVGRNVLIASRGDVYPTNYKWYIDGVFSVLIMALPLCACGYLMNKFRFGAFFT